jgi:Domain of unknown function (DUF1906)
MSRSLRVATLAVLVGGWAALGAPAASARSITKVVVYHRYRLAVPVSWPVFDLRTHPQTCVRFNRHAVYLGTPGPAQRCPAHSVGRTESIAVSPLTARAASGQALPGAGDGSSARVIVGRGRLVVTATWRAHRGVIRRALGRDAMLGPDRRVRYRVASGAARSGPRAHAAAVTYTGLGFDPCATPSMGAMSAWGASPYRAVGVYVGGTNLACSQPNLTSTWTRTEEAAGWHLIPTYVGLQAPASSCSCAPINPSHAAAEGDAAANDAMARSAAVGIGRGSPIYFDMEAYSRGGGNTAAVLAFLSAWTSTLHSAGYVSGVYSSAGSGIRDLVAALGTSFVPPDDIWIADWNGLHTTSDPYVPSSAWPSHQRLHQYSGGQNVTYGGVTINIDGDYLDGATAGKGGGLLVPDGTFVQVAGSNSIYRIAGGAPLFVSSWDPFGGPQPVAVLTPQQFASLNHVPADRTFLTTPSGASYRVAGGAPILVTNWALFGGTHPAVLVDEWDIDNISDPLAHLNAKPIDGTIVEGLPSHVFWGFSAGNRGRISPSSGAIAVDEAGLNPFVQVAELTGSAWCIVPRLRHMTISRAAATLRRAHCRLGSIRRPARVRRRHVLRVKSQSSAKGTSHPAMYAVNVTVG